jgi:Ca2+/Na+ antiporter
VADAVVETEVELEQAIHPRRGGGRDTMQAAVALAVVIGARVAMERAASTFGERHAVPGIVTGGLILAGVTSLPNAVAGIYLAARGRGAATLSTAMNSNALNVVVGLLIPGALAGLGSPSAAATLVAGTYLGLTAVVGLSAFLGGGLRRGFGAAMVCLYAGYVVALLSVS